MDRFWSLIAPAALADRQKTLTRHRSEAPLFNALAFFRSGEVVATEILAFLLTPSAPHGQGDEFLIEFLRVLDVQPTPQKLSRIVVETNSPCYVGQPTPLSETSVGNDRRRMMDIVIKFHCGGNDFVVVIESKSHSAPDQQNQVRDYLAYIRQVYSSRKKYLFYLGDGNPPTPESISRLVWNNAIEEGFCRALVYQEVMESWIQRCRAVCKPPPKVDEFLKNFSQFIHLESNMEKESDNEVSETIKAILTSRDTAKPGGGEALEALLAVYALHDFVWEQAVTLFMGRVKASLQEKLPTWKIKVRTYFSQDDPYVELRLAKPSWQDNLWVYLGTENNQDKSQKRRGRCHFDLCVNRKEAFPTPSEAVFNDKNLLRIGPKPTDFVRVLFPAGVHDLRSVDGVSALLDDQAVGEIESEIVHLIGDYEATLDKLIEHSVYPSEPLH